jgi:hypothetical protein
VQNIISDLDLPDIEYLTHHLPTKNSWKNHIKAILICHMAEEFQDKVSSVSSLVYASHLYDKVIVGKMASHLIFSTGDISVS